MKLIHSPFLQHFHDSSTHSQLFKRPRLCTHTHKVIRDMLGWGEWGGEPRDHELLTGSMGQVPKGLGFINKCLLMLQYVTLP